MKGWQLRYATLAVAAAALTACGSIVGLDSRREEFVLSIHGVVRSSVDGSPIARANVYADGQPGFLGFGWFKLVEAGPDGSYTVVDTIGRGVCPISLTASTKSFFPDAKSVLCSSADQEIDFILEPLSNFAVTVKPTSVRIASGATFRLNAAVTGPSGQVVSYPVTWSSSAPEIATVDSWGVVTGLAEGTAVITGDVGGEPGHAVVTVQAAQTSAMGPTAYVVSRDGVTALSLENESVLGPPIPMGDAPKEIAATPDGSRLLVRTMRITT